VEACLRKYYLRFFKLFILLLLISSRAPAGPNSGLACFGESGTNGYVVTLIGAVTGGLIWATVFTNEKQIALMACVPESRSPSQEIYICRNGVDDRYQANPQGYSIKLKRQLPQHLSSATLLLNGEELADLKHSCPVPAGDCAWDLIKRSLQNISPLLKKNP
jgi:hypothetical protein